MKAEELKKILDEHNLWLQGKGGVRADLSYADLSSANLRSAKNVPDTARLLTQIVPDEGDFVGFKKCRDGILVKVLIPKTAARSNSTTRKCRAEFVKVLEVFGGKEGVSINDGTTKYIKGKVVKCGKWEENRWIECGGGIHFFITRAEAEAY